MTSTKVLFLTLFLAAVVVCSGQSQDNTAYPPMGGASANNLQQQFAQQAGSQDPSQLIRSGLSAFSNWVSTMQQRSQKQLRELQQQPQVQEMIQQLQRQLAQQIERQPPQLRQMMEQLQQQPQVRQLLQQLQQQDPTRQASASRLYRRKRAAEDSNSNSPVTIQLNTDGGTKARSTDPPQSQVQILLNQDQQQPPQRDVTAYEASLQQQESQLQIMMRQLQSNVYMPSPEQMIHLLTAVLTLALMLQFGPSVGTNIPLIQSVVRQLVPMVMAATTFTADQGASAMDGGAQVGPNGISNVPLQPVAAPSSAMGQAL